jgi:integrase
MKADLTDKLVSSIQPPPKGQIEVWDTRVTNLYLRVSQGGSKTWYARVYRSGEPPRKRLGTYPEIRVTAARDIVRMDALGARVESDTLKSVNSATTFGAVCAKFLYGDASHAMAELGESTRREWRRLYDAELDPALGRIDPADAAGLRAGVQRVLAALGRRSVYTRNRAFEAARRMYNWGVGQDLIAPAPVFAGIEKLPEKARGRVLSDDELRRILAAIDLDYPHWRVYWKLLLHTALRRGSILKARIDHVDEAAAALIVPAENVKGRVETRRSVAVPLVAEALAAIRHRLALGLKSPMLVANYRTGGEIENPQKAKERIAATADVHDWHVHDIRTTISTNLGRFGLPTETIDRVLYHASGSRIHRVYNQWEYFEDKKAALERWAAHLGSLRTT